MFRAKNLLPDPKRFLKKWFSLGIFTDLLVQLGQIVEAGRRVGMFGATQTPCYVNRLFSQGNRLLILSLFRLNNSEIR